MRSYRVDVLRCKGSRRWQQENGETNKIRCLKNNHDANIKKRGKRMPSTTSATGDKKDIVTTFSNFYRGQKNYFPCNASIDFITITTDVPHHEVLRLIHKITSQSRSTNYYKTKSFAYNRVLKCIYNYHSSSYTLFILRANKAFLPKLLIKILQPDRNLLLHVDELLNNVFSISYIEFAFDFYSDHPACLYQFFKRYLFLKWPGKKFNPGYASTTYLNNIRKSKSKGVRIYRKKEASTEAVRVEVVYKRKMLKKLGIVAVNDLLIVKPPIVTKYLKLMEFDFDLFRARFFRRRGNSNIDITDLDSIVEQIEHMIDSKGIREADMYAKQFSGQSCLVENEKKVKLCKAINKLSFF
jgi:hypothetical protein